MRLLALRLSALGDVIHTIPAVIALRESGADISWVVEAPYAELVELVAGVRAIPVSMKKWGRHLLASRVAISASLRAMRGHDVSVDFQGLLKSAALGWLSRAGLRYGFDRDAVRERGSLLFTNRHIAIDRTQHVVDWNVQLARAVIPSVVSDLGAMTGNWPAFLLPGFDEYRGKVVLLPGAGRPEKQWPVDRFAALARDLGGRALVVWGPNEETLARSIGAPMAPPTNLRELATILKNAAVVVGGDTGPLHLAAALGTRVVGLFGPTNPRRNGPYGQLDSVVSTWDGVRSMDTITTGEVLVKINLR